MSSSFRSATPNCEMNCGLGFGADKMLGIQKFSQQLPCYGRGDCWEDVRVFQNLIFEHHDRVTFLS